MVNCGFIVKNYMIWFMVRYLLYLLCLIIPSLSDFGRSYIFVNYSNETVDGLSCMFSDYAASVASNYYEVCTAELSKYATSLPGLIDL